MKQALATSLLALLLIGCGNADADNVEGTERIVPDEEMTVSAPAMLDQPSNIPDDMMPEGKVLITVERLIPEPEACLLMMSVINGTDETVNAGLFAFDVTGNGERAGANMFPQTAEPDMMKTAQIVLPGADCDNAKIIEGGQINCREPETGESCIDKTELRDGIVEFSAND